MDVETLIGEIFVRPPLWDRKDRNHHNRFVLDILWDEVAEELNTTRTTVRNKWKALRDKFRTTLASAPKSNTVDAQITHYKGEWKYFKSLLFLRDQFTSKKCEENFPKMNVFDESSDQNLLEEGTECSDSGLSNNDTPYSFQYPFSEKRPRLTYSAQENVTQELLQVDKEKLQHLHHKNYKKEDDDEDLNFFKSLLPHVKTFSAYDKMEYRMRVMKLTQDFLKFSQSNNPETETGVDNGSTSSRYKNETDMTLK